MYQIAADIRDMYLYKKLSVQVGSWCKGGTILSRQKIKGRQCTTHKIRYRQRKITLIVHFLIKARTFAYIVVDHDLTNDFSHDSKQNRSKNSLFLGKIVKIMCKNRDIRKNICRLHIC